MQRFKLTAVVLTALVLALGSIFLLLGNPSQETQAASGFVDSTSTSAAETLITYSGGPVRAKRALTQDSPTTLAVGAAYVNLTSASITYGPVPAGTSDLFNLSFSAECRLLGAANTAANQDWVGIQILVTPSVGAPFMMEPNDPVSPTAFCAENSFNMHKGNWVARLSGGAAGVTYNFKVQWRVVDSAPATAGLSGWMDDWTFEVVVYD